jgi:hypothetical protein
MPTEGGSMSKLKLTITMEAEVCYRDIHRLGS